MGKEDLIEAARLGNYPACEKILSVKPKKAGPFASLRRGSGGCNTRDASGYTALHYASLNGHRDIVELLLSYEASCNSADEKGSSPLHLASWAGKSDIVRTLLTHGPSIANVNLTNSDKETALHSAAQFGHLASVKVLLEHGADPNIKNCREETAFDLAALYGRTETVKLLLETHPELVGPYTAYGGAMYCHTPLHLASRNGHKEVVQLILETGFDINVRTSRGTSLHEAALCGKLEVVKVLLDSNINVELRDQNDKTVLSLMDEVKTPRSKEIIHVILNHMGIRRRSTVSSSLSVGGSSINSTSGSHAPHSPYDNISITQSLDSYTLELEFSSASVSRSSSRCQVSPLPRRPSWIGGEASAASAFEAVQPRPAKSVEDMVERRISSLSTTSGCSDCTTATLQNAKSFGSSFFSGDEITPRLMHTSGDDSTSLSSTADIPDIGGVNGRDNLDSEAIYEEIPDLPEPQNFKSIESESLSERRNKMSLSVSPNLLSSSGTVNKSVKPALPAKPAHIRPGLKPVKIPTVDDKMLLQYMPPKKPPRRNVSVSPVRTHSSGALLELDSTRQSDHCKNSHSINKYVYSTRSGSKSFDEIDDILGEKPTRKPGCATNRKKNRRTLSSGADYLHQGGGSLWNKNGSQHDYIEEMDTSNNSLLHQLDMDNTRMSCEELLSMTRSLHESNSSNHIHEDHEADLVCQRCLLNNLSNRALLGEGCQHENNEFRFISQRQYKRKLRRDCPSYATMHRSQRKNGAFKGSDKMETSAVETGNNLVEDDNGGVKMTIMSKTTYKLRTFDDSRQVPDLNLELMEIPLSPTHYDAPPTPDHEPPSAFETESRIQKAIDKIRNESNRKYHSKATETESWFLTPLGKSIWGERTRQYDEKFTTMDIDMQLFYHNIKCDDQKSGCHLETLGSPSSASSSLLSYDRSSLKLDQQIGSDSSSKNSAVHLNNHPSDDVDVKNNFKTDGGEILSPFDEKEEWNKITKIIDSFGVDIGNAVKKSTTPNNSPNEDFPTWKRKDKVLSSVEDWLHYIGLGQYYQNFMKHGFDELDFVGCDILLRQDIRTIGISNEQDIIHLLEELQKKGNSKGFSKSGQLDLKSLTVHEWLESLSLSIYKINFSDNFYTSMERISTIWDDELTTILDIEKLGHRKRILMSVAGVEGIQSRFGKVLPDEGKEMEVDIKSSVLEDLVVTSSDTSQSQERKEAKKRTVEVGTLTLGRSRKKKAAPQPPGMSQLIPTSSSITPLSSTSTALATVTLRREKSTSQKKTAQVENAAPGTAPSPPSSGSKTKQPTLKKKRKNLDYKGSEFLAFKVKYYTKQITKEFRGTDTTKSAIESSKKSRGGRSRFLVVSEKDLKILKRDAKEEVANHEINQVCCVVRDKENPAVFGYVTATESGPCSVQTVAHVFTTDSQEKAAEILSVICEGFTSRPDQILQLDDALEASKTSTPSPPSSVSSSADSKPPKLAQSKGQSSQSRFRSDQLVSRMRQFFQGTTSTDRNSFSGNRRSGSPNTSDARRKRGGSVDNLLDELGEDGTHHQHLNSEVKKKSISSKNLSLGPLEEVKVTTV